VQYLEIAPPDETIIAESFSHVTISLFHITRRYPFVSEPLLPNSNSNGLHVVKLHVGDQSVFIPFVSVALIRQ